MPKKYPKNILLYELHDDERPAALSEIMSALKKMGYVGVGLELDESLNSDGIELRILSEIQSIKALLRKTHIITNTEMRTSVREKLLGYLVGYAKYLLICKSAKEIGLALFTFDKNMAEARHPGTAISSSELYSAEREQTMAKNILKANMLYGGPVLCLAGLNHKAGLETYLGDSMFEHIVFDELFPKKEVDESDMPKTLAVNMLKRTNPIYTEDTFLQGVVETLEKIPTKENKNQKRSHTF